MNLASFRSWIHGRPFTAGSISFALAALLMASYVAWLLTTRDTPAPSARSTPTVASPRSYSDAIRIADRNVEAATKRERASPHNWLVEERLAHALMARARLSGSFADYAAAQTALDRGFAKAPLGSGPHLTRMALDVAMGRFDSAAKMIASIDLRRISDKIGARNEMMLTRGDIAFYRGDYSGARALYQSADGNDPRAMLRTANLYAQCGQPDEALTLIDRAEQSSPLHSAHFLADLALRRGTIELQRGNWDAARRHFDHAVRLFPGWWLAEAYHAQLLALNGQSARAIGAFLRVARKSGSPEAMDALASLYLAGDDREQSAFWADQARMVLNERLRLFPEVSYSHAVRHILAFGDPTVALTLARRDHANRPNGQTATILAWALIANDDPDDALKMLDPVLRSQWASAESHLAAAQAHLLLGQIEPAETQRKAALKINPRAADRTAALSWFGGQVSVATP